MGKLDLAILHNHGPFANLQSPNRKSKPIRMTHLSTFYFQILQKIDVKHSKNRGEVFFADAVANDLLVVQRRMHAESGNTFAKKYLTKRKLQFAIKKKRTNVHWNSGIHETCSVPPLLHPA